MAKNAPTARKAKENVVPAKTANSTERNQVQHAATIVGYDEGLTPAERESNRGMPTASAPASAPAALPKPRRGSGELTLPPGVNFPEHQDFPGHGEEYTEEMNRLVPCRILDDMRGRIGLRIAYSFKRDDEYLLPKWFAIQYHNLIVIKE